MACLGISEAIGKDDSNPESKLTWYKVNECNCLNLPCS